MKQLLQHEALRTHFSQLWKFAVCGGLGFIIDISSLTLLVERFAVDPRIAVILSSLVGASFVFVANKFFTFRNREKRYGSQVFKFFMVYGVSILTNAVISNLLLWAGVYYLLAKIIAIGIGAVWNYLLSHGFVFKKTEDVDAVIV
jgi:putative flippase GtrA